MREKLEHLGSVMHALDITVMLHHYRRDPMAVARTAGEILTLGAEHELEEYSAKGRIFEGWSLVAQGDVAEGLRRIDGGFEVMREIGTPEDFPVYQCMRADAMRRLGDVDAALEVLAEGSAVIVAEGVNYWGAEIARHRALAEMARARPDTRVHRDLARRGGRHRRDAGRAGVGAARGGGPASHGRETPRRGAGSRPCSTASIPRRAAGTSTPRGRRSPGARRSRRNEIVARRRPPRLSARRDMGAPADRCCRSSESAASARSPGSTGSACRSSPPAARTRGRSRSIRARA